MNNYIDALSRATGVKEITDVCAELTQSLDCDYFLYAGIEPLPLSSPQLILLGNYPSEWMQRYEEKDYARIDPTVWHAGHRVIPLYWCDADKSDAAVAELFQDARAHGVASGVTIPLHSVNGYTAILTFVSSTDSQAIYERLRSDIANLLLFGYSLHDKMMKDRDALGESECREPLSELEKQCLLWASEGKSSWEISKILSIKERTVVFHLNNATKKLGAVNRQHAIACAVALGELRSCVSTIPDKYKF